MPDGHTHLRDARWILERPGSCYRAERIFHVKVFPMKARLYETHEQQRGFIPKTSYEPLITATMGLVRWLSD